MKQIFLPFLLTYSQIAPQMAVAGELDQEQEILRSQLARKLPGTLVVRSELKDKAGKFEVLNVATQLPADKSLAEKLATAPFQAASLDKQLTGRAGVREADVISSSDTWFLGFLALALGAGVLIGRSTAVAAPAYVTTPDYVVPRAYVRTRTYVRTPAYSDPAYFSSGPIRAPGYAYAPTYQIGGYSYPYRQYYAYRAGRYRYAYYNSPYAYVPAANYAPEYSQAYWNYR